MKKYTLLFAFVLTALSIFGQGIVEKYYSDLEAQEKTTSVFVSSAMFEMAAKLDIQTEDEDFNELKEFVNSVQSFSLIKVPELTDIKSVFKTGKNKLSNTHDELVRIKDESERISVYIDEEDGIIYELAVIGIVEGDFLAASLIGEMDLDQISKFINNVQGDSFSGLRAIKDAGVTDMKVYPNPTSKGSELKIEIPIGLKGGTANIYSLDGELVKTVSCNSSTLSIETGAFSSGNYIVELTKDGTTVKQKVIILE